MSNVTTFTPSYPDAQRNAIIRNGLDAATQGNGTLDSQWPTCVACAVLSRSWTRTGTAVPAACSSCFERYCWNGTTAVNAAVVGGGGGAEYNPTFKIGDSTKGESAGARMVGRSAWALVVGLVAALMVL
jgi:lysophospholipase